MIKILAIYKLKENIVIKVLKSLKRKEWNKMEEKMINLTIDDQKISVPKGTTILQAAKQAGIDIPTLCPFFSGTFISIGFFKR